METTLESLDGFELESRVNLAQGKIQQQHYGTILSFLH
ncbi:unnamed protein product [Brassica oleracea]|uniref:(rape) hypothetical protein n=1 Tax=Brassica napus TaxID=3708 RepID=A0A816RQX6_BRANA|nr:unnamed protein product [Brassica napus]